MKTSTGVRVSALASGSSGNAFLVEASDVKLLFDAGLNASTLESYLAYRGTAPSDLSAIFVSHEHIDHLRGASTLARRYGLPVIASEGTFLAGAAQFGRLPERLIQRPGREVCIGGVTVRSFLLSHDAAEPTGFWIEVEGSHIVICTDLGCVTDSVLDALDAADLLVLEANHDLQRLWRGRYPPALKKRVAGPFGHLANEDAGLLVSAIAQDGRPRTVWLAHLSAANNTPALAFDTVSEPLRRDGCTHLDVAVLTRDTPSHVWSAGARDMKHVPEAVPLVTAPAIVGS